jgi:hypothetical protein
MRYKPVDDIIGLENKEIDAYELDKVLYKLIEDTRFALKDAANFKRNSLYNRELSSMLRDQMLLFKATHQSVRVLIEVAYTNTKENSR